jgi:hypothetical protein
VFLTIPKIFDSIFVIFIQTMKKKYFVLRRESAKLPARLEYYDSDSKFKAGTPPKR